MRSSAVEVVLNGRVVQLARVHTPTHDCTVDHGLRTMKKCIEFTSRAAVGFSSHRGHKTGVSVLDALTEGKSRSKIMEWMLVTDEILVAHYGEREYIVTPFVAKMFDWM